MRFRGYGRKRTPLPPAKRRIQHSRSPRVAKRHYPYSFRRSPQVEERPRIYTSPDSQLQIRRKERPLRDLSPHGRSTERRRDFAGNSDDRISHKQLRDQTDYGEGFSHRDSPSMDYRPKYPMRNSNGDAVTSLKYLADFGPGINREKDFLGRGSSALDGRGINAQKSSHLDDGVSRSFLAVTSNDNPAINSVQNTGNFLSSSAPSLYKDDDLQYRDHLNLAKTLSEGYHKEGENMMYSSSDYSHSLMTMSQSMGFQSMLPMRRKDESLGLTNSCLPLPADGLPKCSSKFSEYSGSPPLASARDRKGVIYQRGSLNSFKGEHCEYGRQETGRREKDEFSAKGLYGKVHPSDGEDYENRVSTRKYAVDLELATVNDMKHSRRRFGEGNFWDHQSLREEPNVNRKPSTTRDKEYVSTGSKYLEFGTRVSGVVEKFHSRGGYGSEMETGPEFYEETLYSLPRPECDPDMHRLNGALHPRLNVELVDNYSPSQMVQKRTYCMDEEVDIFGPSDEGQKRKYGMDGDEYTFGPSDKVHKRNYSMDEEVDIDKVQKRTYGMDEEITKHNARSTSSNSSDISRGMHELTDVNELSAEEDLDVIPSSKASAFSRLQYYERASPRVVASKRLSSRRQGFTTNRKILTDRKPSIKQRLKPASVNVQGENHIARRSEFHKLDKSQHSRENTDDYGPSQSKESPVKGDPPEDSEEFKQLVDKAFLRFSKHLNETSAQQRRYKEQGKAGTLLCSVCGSLSKEFVDTRSLVSHTFSSLMVGKRANHLGLFKALCVLMGWNSHVVSGRTWIHQVLPNAEASALKENLILWPPLVIVHNSSIGNKNLAEQKVVTVEGMEAILKELGFSAGMTNVCRGKPANQSIMVVKFMPTFSGLLGAERLHKYFLVKKHGREEFQQISSDNSNNSEESRGGQVDKLERFLYGYLGISDDLDKLEIKTKERCAVKSKKDIQKIADAALQTE